MTTPDIQQAKEWAESRAYGNYTLGEETQAAVKVIQSLPNIVVDGEEIITIYDKYRDDAITLHEAFSAAVALIPAPAPRTLADMPLGELKDYVGREVMVDGWANPTMLVSVIDNEGAVLARRLNKPWPFVEVRPLSDLTPVEASEQEAENTPEPVQPRPEDVPAGEAWLIAYEGGLHTAFKAGVSHDSAPWIVHLKGQDDYEWVREDEITLTSRLVPENKENA